MEKKELMPMRVTKANRLIEARYKLNLVEQKLILFAVSKLNAEQQDFNIQKLELKDLSEAIGDQYHRYSEIRKVVRELRKKEVIIQTGEKELITGWLSSIEFEKKTGIIELEFSKKLAPYLLQLGGAYKSYKLENVIKMKSVHAIRVYEMLKQWECKKTISIKLEDLKKKLMIETEYDRFTDFEKRVLEPAKTEINEYSDLYVIYRKVKKGRSIESIEFEIEHKYGSVDLEAEEIKLYKKNGGSGIDEIRTLSGLTGVIISDKQLLEIYEIAITKTSHPTYHLDAYDYIKLNYEYSKNRAKKGLYAYLKKAVESDYANARIKLLGLE